MMTHDMNCIPRHHMFQMDIKNAYLSWFKTMSWYLFMIIFRLSQNMSKQAWLHDFLHSCRWCGKSYFQPSGMVEVWSTLKGHLPRLFCWRSSSSLVLKVGSAVVGSWCFCCWYRPACKGLWLFWRVFFSATDSTPQSEVKIICHRTKRDSFCLEEPLFYQWFHAMTSDFFCV